MILNMRANPIFGEERNHLLRTQPFTRLKRPHKLLTLNWLAVGLRWLLIVLSVVIYLSAWVSTLFNLDLYQGITPNGATWLIALTGILIAAEILGLMFRTLARGAHLITREQQGGRLDMLMLTGLSARTIIAGKWRAALRSLLPDILYVSLLRVMGSLILGWLSNYASSWWRDNTGSPTLPGLIAMPVLIFVSTALFVGLLLAIGVMTSAAMNSSGKAMAAAGSLMLGLWIGTLMVTQFFMVRFVYPNYSYPSVRNYIASLVFSTLESGTMAIAWLVKSGWSYNDLDQLPFMLGGLVSALILYSITIAVLLFIAERLLIRRGALSVER